VTADRAGSDPTTQTDPGTGAESAPAPAADELVLDQTFTADNLFSLRNAVAAHGAELGLIDLRLSDLVLLAHELASNAIRHAGADARAPGRLRLWRTVEADGRTAVVCEVSDSGPGLADPAQAGRQPVAITSPNGRGLWIARQVTDRLDIASSAAGTTVTATLRLS